MSCLDGTVFDPAMLAGRIRREGALVELDLRGMVPPQPALCILQVLADEDKPDTLVVLLDRNPINLYEELEHRGWRAVSGEMKGSGYQVVIRSMRA